MLGASGGRLVIAIDGKTVRGAKGKKGKAPHLVAALAHGIGAVLGQVAVDEKANEIPAVRELLKALAGLARRGDHDRRDARDAGTESRCRTKGTCLPVVSLLGAMASCCLRACRS